MTQQQANFEDDEMLPIGVLDMNADVRGRTVLVSVKLGVEEKAKFGYGIAKCRKDDRFDLNIGFNIGLGRALQDLGKRVEEEAISESKCEVDAVKADAAREIRSLAKFIESLAEGVAKAIER